MLWLTHNTRVHLIAFSLAGVAITNRVQYSFGWTFTCVCVPQHCTIGCAFLGVATLSLAARSLLCVSSEGEAPASVMVAVCYSLATRYSTLAASILQQAIDLPSDESKRARLRVTSDSNSTLYVFASRLINIYHLLTSPSGNWLLLYPTETNCLLSVWLSEVLTCGHLDFQSGIQLVAVDSDWTSDKYSSLQSPLNY